MGRLGQQITPNICSYWKGKAMRAGVMPGRAFPDYELPDHTGAVRRLSEIQAGAPELGWGPGVAVGGTQR